MRRLPAPIVLAHAWVLTLATASLVTVLPSASHAQQWGEVANISATMGVNDGRICTGEASRGDIGCTANAPYVSLTTGAVGIGTASPSATLHVNGIIRMAASGESCDTNRTGAIKYQSGAFYICQSTSNGWEALATTGVNSNNDRIISGTTQMITYNNTSATIATAGVERIVVGTTGNVGIAQQPVAGKVLSVSGSTRVRGTLDLGKIDANGNPTNLAIGFESGDAITSGVNNVALGYRSLLTNTSGADNTALGNQALYSNTSGLGNTAVGSSALVENTSGFSNVAIGVNALQNNTVGGTNVAVGYDSAKDLVNGFNNITIGFDSFVPEATTSHFLNIGNSIFGDLGDTALPASRIGKNAKIGINWITPTVALEVSGTISATRLVGDGSGLTNISASAISGLTSDRITSSTTSAVIANQSGGTVSFTLASTPGAAYLHPTLGFVGPGVSTSGPVSSSVVNTGLLTLRAVSGSAGVSFSAPGDNLGDHTATQALDMDGNNITNAGTINGTFVGDGSGLTNLNVQGDRITSSTTSAVIANQSGGTVSFTLGSTPGAAYLHPTLGFVGPGVSSSGPVSSSIVNTGFLVLRGSTGSAGVSMSAPGDNLGDHTAIQNLDMGGNNITNAGTINGTFVGDGSGLTNLPITTDRITSGTAYVQANGPGGNVTISGTTYIGYNTATSASLEIGYGATGNRSAILDFVGDTTYTDYGLRLSRENTGANAMSGLTSRGTGGMFFTVTEAGPIMFSTTGAERIRILANGNIGISTTNPSTTLHVSGTLRIANGGESCDTNRTGAIKYQSGAFYICQSTSNGWEALATTGVNSNNDRIISGTTQMITYNNTSATIATAGVERIVVGTTGNVGIAQQPVAGTVLSVSGSSYFSGNMGLGTSNPNAKLEIIGRTSTTTIQLSNNPADTCTSADYGTMKMVGGRPYVCRP